MIADMRICLLAAVFGSLWLAQPAHALDSCCASCLTAVSAVPAASARKCPGGLASTAQWPRITKAGWLANTREAASLLPTRGIRRNPIVRSRLRHVPVERPGTRDQAG